MGNRCIVGDRAATAKAGRTAGSGALNGRGLKQAVFATPEAGASRLYWGEHILNQTVASIASIRSTLKIL
jgi:hypothetical protein